MTMFPQETTRSNHDIHPIHSRLDRLPRIIHITSDMSQDFGSLQTERTDGFTVVVGFGRGGGRGEFDVFDSESIEAGGNSERRVGKAVRLSS